MLGEVASRANVTARTGMVAIKALHKQSKQT